MTKTNAAGISETISGDDGRCWREVEWPVLGYLLQEKIIGGREAFVPSRVDRPR
jgi:hypothetical protein